VELHAHTVVGYVEVKHLAMRAKLYQAGTRLAAVEERAVNVRAMRHRVGVSVSFAELFVERYLDYLLAADAIHYQQALDEHRFPRDELAGAQRVRARTTRSGDLYPCAELAEFRCLLERDYPKPFDGQSERSSKTADASPGDGYRLGVSSPHPAQL
jgi:hypothetical protein